MTNEFGIEVPEQECNIPLRDFVTPGKIHNFKPMQPATISPADMLQQASETFKQRAEVYGDNYKRFGQIMNLLIPNFSCRENIFRDDWNRLGLLVQIVSKLTRYCENFNKGGHDDSLNDLSVYAAMLRSLDKEINQAPF